MIVGLMVYGLFVMILSVLLFLVRKDKDVGGIWGVSTVIILSFVGFIMGVFVLIGGTIGDP